MARQSDQGRFWDRWARRYAAMPVADPGSYEIKLAMTREHLTPQSQVFEFGCGTGSTAIAHAPYAGRILGLDVSARMVEIARSKAQAAGVRNVTFDQGDILTWPMEAASWDVVMGHSILHLLDARREVIDRAFRMLKPGGLFVSSTTCIGDMARPMGWIVAMGRSVGLLPSVNVFSPATLEAEITEAGFALETVWQPRGRAKAVFILARKG